MLTNFLSENFRLKKDQIFDGLSPEELNILTERVLPIHTKEVKLFSEREGYQLEFSTSRKEG
jgi:hypothetical protein